MVDLTYMIVITENIWFSILNPTSTYNILMFLNGTTMEEQYLIGNLEVINFVLHLAISLIYGLQTLKFIEP